MGADPILMSPIENDSSDLIRSRFAGVRSEHIQSVFNLCDARIQSRGVYEGPERRSGSEWGKYNSHFFYEILATQKSQGPKERKKNSQTRN